MRVGYETGDIKSFYRNFIIALWKRFYVVSLIKLITAEEL